MTYVLIGIIIFSLLEYLDKTPWYKIIGDIFYWAICTFVALWFIFHYLGSSSGV